MHREAIVRLICDKVREVAPDLGDRAIQPTDSMADLGLDSVDRQEVVLLVLEALQLDVPLVALRGPRNIGQLADLLGEKQPA